MGTRRSTAALILAVSGVSYLIGGGAQLSMALLTDSEDHPSTFTTAASFGDATAPTVASSVVSKTTPYVPGHIRQGGTYYIYANVTDAGSGVATVTADVSTVTTGQTAVAMVAGSYTIGGVSYTYRSSSVNADATLAEGAKAYSITATDGAANTVTQGGFSVTVDNTRPTGTNVQTTNAGTVGRAEAGDAVIFTFSEPMEPESIVAGWTGAPTNVVVRVTQNLLGDQLTIRNAANTAVLPLGTINLGGTNYVTVTRDFGASGTASTVVQTGATITVTLGTPSGAVGTELIASAMVWTPSATATDPAGNTCQTTVAAEALPLDVDF